jgi:hypothetical protein
MRWQEILASGTSSTQAAYHDYIDERLAFHSKVCMSIASSFEDIRASQASIAELQRMKNLPETLRREAAAKGT